MDCPSAFDQALSSFRAEANEEEFIISCGHVARRVSTREDAHSVGDLPNYYADASAGTV
jgi:hypothetical protein